MFCTCSQMTLIRQMIFFQLLLSSHVCNSDCSVGSRHKYTQQHGPAEARHVPQLHLGLCLAPLHPAELHHHVCAHPVLEKLLSCGIYHSSVQSPSRF